MPMDPLVGTGGTGMAELTSGIGQREDGVFRSGVLLQVSFDAVLGVF